MKSYYFIPFLFIFMNNCMELSQARDYAVERQMLLGQAKGHEPVERAQAHLALGKMFHAGLGGSKDIARARRHFESAMLQKATLPAALCAGIFLAILDLETNPVESFRRFNLGSEFYHCPQAQYLSYLMLGICYMRGWGTEISGMDALSNLNTAALQSEDQAIQVRALLALAELKGEGKLVMRDMALARDARFQAEVIIEQHPYLRRLTNG